MGNKKTRLAYKRKNSSMRKYNLAKKQNPSNEYNLQLTQKLDDISLLQMKQSETDRYNKKTILRERYNINETSESNDCNNEYSYDECCGYEYLDNVEHTSHMNTADECCNYEYLDYADAILPDSNHADFFLEDYLDSEYLDRSLDDGVDENVECMDSEKCDKNDCVDELKGYRITDIRYLFEQFQNLCQHSSHNKCKIADMSFVGEKRKALKSTFLFECKNCQFIQSVHSVNARGQSLNVNYASVLAAYAIGIGFYQSEEFFANLQIPFMSSSTFDKYQKSVQSDLKEVAEKSMRDAMEAEKLIAIEHGEVDCNNTPLLTVGGDGSWPKRSFRTGYNSLSGTACLIGVNTQKVIWLDVRNKYCKECSNAHATGVRIDHTCNTNYIGPSTGIEADILLDGFRRSEQDFGVRYQKFVADGDSKAYKAISEARIYTNPTLLVQKIECVLHLKRAGRGRLLNIKGLESGKIEEIMKAITCATNHWQKQDISTITKISNLRKDIVNAPYHIFGDHAKCHEYFCDKKKHEKDTNYVLAMIKSGEMLRILDAISRLVDNAESLLCNMNTNAVEQFNSIICKHIGGKRINFCTALSYAARVWAAVISYNTGRLGSTMLKLKFPDSNIESSLIYILETKRIELNRDRKTKPKYLSRSYLTDSNYGTNTCEKPDLQLETFELMKTLLIEQLKSRQKERLTVQSDTRGQHNNLLFRTYRSEMITSSIFGKICNARGITSYPDIVRKLLYTKDVLGKKDVRHYVVNEDTAIKQLEKFANIEVMDSGLFIDDVHEFLGATPCGLIEEDGIFEIKIPFNAKDSLVNDAIIDRRITFWNVVKKPLVKQSRKTAEESVIKKPIKRLVKQSRKTTAESVIKKPIKRIVNKSEKAGVKQIPTKRAAKKTEKAIKGVTKKPMLRIFEQYETTIKGVNKKHPYYFQVQGQLHVTQREYCLFVVWTEKDFKLERIERDDVFWKTEMEGKLVNFYKNSVLSEIIYPRYPRKMSIR